MSFGRLFYVMLVLIQHGGGVIQFNISEDATLHGKERHPVILWELNRIDPLCRQTTNMTSAAVSEGMLNIIIENKMAVSAQLGCYMFCFTEKVGMIKEAHILDMRLLKIFVIRYQPNLRPYPRVRAILSVMVACFAKMKNLERDPPCDLFRNVLRCVALYEKQYGPYMVRPT